jgi:uncharacterized membrane protein
MARRTPPASGIEGIAMLRVSLLLFTLLLISVAAFIVATTGALPDLVAAHFGASNFANGWMTRSGYLAFTLAFATVLPIVIAAAVGWLPRIAQRSVNIPNRDYWMAPERRSTTLDSIAAYGLLAGCLVMVLIAGVHRVIIEANAVVPPQLPAREFWTLLAGFLVAFAVWIGAFWLRFRVTLRAIDGR